MRRGASRVSGRLSLLFCLALSEGPYNFASLQTLSPERPKEGGYTEQQTLGIA